MRDAYEHIEERAIGLVKGLPHVDALTIFDHVRIVQDGVIAYGSHQFDLASDAPAIIAAARDFLKAAAGEVLPPTALPTQTMTPRLRPLCDQAIRPR
ncbi:hypothetical protein MAUB1S_02372 [Mycolicibacterium aubagnense]